MNYEGRIINGNEEETSKDIEIGQDKEPSASDKLSSLLDSIRQKGGIQGSGKFYTYEELKERIDATLNSENPELESITRTDGLRNAVRAALLEQTKEKMALNKPDISDEVIPVKKKTISQKKKTSYKL